MSTKLSQLFALLSFLFLAYLNADCSDRDRAFYAVSSLRSYTEAKLSGDSYAHIFEATDIAKLWETAENHLNSADMALAKKTFYAGLQANDLEAQASLVEARNRLRNLWRSLNRYRREFSSQVTAKGLDHRHFLLNSHTDLFQTLRGIFSSPDVIATPESFTNAGFITISERPSGMFVASHPHLKKHLVKVYIESKKPKLNWEWCIFRCWGVQNIQNLIDEKGLKHFVVPEKKIFPLVPIDLDALEEDLIHMTVPVALVVTNMRLVKKSESRAAWKEKATKRHIQELYCILSHGYSSCCLVANIPYTQSGKFTCIDTENPQRELPYHHVGRFLSKKKARYFNHLVKTGGEGLPF